MAYKDKFMQRRSETSGIREVIDAMLDSYKLRKKFDEEKLISSWESIMGKPIARRTEKIFIKDKTLFVKLNSAPLRHELTIAKTKVLMVLYRHIDKDLIEDIKFY